MSRVMLLVSAQGATMAETRVVGEGPEVDRVAEQQLRAEARVLGFSEEDVRSARVGVAGDPPNQP